MVAERLLDESSLRAIKTYVDSKAEEAGKVDDVRINSTTVVTSKVANIAVEGTYNSSTNKIATQSTITDAINALDVSNISGFGVGKTLATLTETDGKIAATFQDIQLASTAKVTGLDEALASKVPTSREIAGLALSEDITTASLITALGLQQAMTYIGVATTTKPSAGQYVQTVIGGTTYYVPLTTSGAATQVNATKGQILTVGTKEYICTTEGASGTNVFSEMGDEGSYALKTITVTGTGALGGGGNLTTNRTITHNAGNAPSKSLGFYKFSTDAYSHINEVTEVAKSDLTGLGVADDSTVVHKTGNETIDGRKTFTSAPVISEIYNTAKNDVVASFTYNTSNGSEAISNGHFIALGDDDGNETNKPVTAYAASDLDTYYYNTGITLRDADEQISPVKLAFPAKSGTFALTSDIPSLSNYVKGPSSATDGRIAVFDGATGKLIKDGGTLLSEITSKINTHVNNTNIHVVSAEKTLWNEKADSVEAIGVSGATDNDNYTQLRYSTKKSPTATPTYTNIIATLSYNETLAILQGE